MTTPPPDVDGAKAYLASLTDQLEKLVKEGPEVARKAAALEATASSSDGLVTATVNARGALIKLELDPRIYRRPDSSELAEKIVETTAAAAAEVGERMLDTFEPLGDRSQFEAMLSGDMDRITEDLTARTQHWNR